MYREIPHLQPTKYVQNTNTSQVIEMTHKTSFVTSVTIQFAENPLLHV